MFRGIASEGIDFSDDSARAVICIGIPFADYSDNRIKLKIEFLNNHQKENPNFISGNEWYEADAMTAVNQSLGRVIRHKNDFGTMLCVDERYKKYEKYFSFWIRDNYSKNKNNLNVKVNDFLNINREKFKDSIEQNKKAFNKNNTNLSGFNETIKIDNNIFMKNKNSNKEKQIEDFEGEDEEEEEIIEEEIINRNISSKEKENNSLKKIQNNNIFNFEQKEEEKINTINIKEIKYITNYNDILKTIIQEKPKQKEKKENTKENELYEEWDISKNKEIKKKDNIFEKEEKQAKELLESLKLFAFNNPKELNNILNKYK